MILVLEVRPLAPPRYHHDQEVRTGTGGEEVGGHVELGGEAAVGGVTATDGVYEDVEAGGDAVEVEVVSVLYATTGCWGGAARAGAGGNVERRAVHRRRVLLRNEGRVGRYGVLLDVCVYRTGEVRGVVRVVVVVVVVVGGLELDVGGYDGGVETG